MEDSRKKLHRKQGYKPFWETKDEPEESEEESRRKLHRAPGYKPIWEGESVEFQPEQPTFDKEKTKERLAKLKKLIGRP